MTLQLLHSEFPYILYEEKFIFLFIGAMTTIHQRNLNLNLNLNISRGSCL
jgi:hypothetical protein